MTRVSGVLLLGLSVALGPLLPQPAAQRLPIASRHFLTGTTATMSRSGSPATALQLSKQVGRVTMLWTQPNGIGLYDALTKTNPVTTETTYDAIAHLGLVPVVNLNPWTVQANKGIVRNDGSGERRFDDPEFTHRLCGEASRVAHRLRPMYFSIGNEINSVYEQLGPSTFRGLLRLEQELCRSIHKSAPATKVIVVLSYRQLLHVQGGSRLHLLREVEKCCDIVGLTTYPWQHFAGPSDLPHDYYRRIERYTRRPIAFTEIGWSSDPDQGGSEEEQAEFLLCFLERTRGMALEFVNWAFLHDLPEASASGFVVQRSHLGLGLRYYNGSPKKVWDLFCVLAQLPEVRRPHRP